MNAFEAESGVRGYSRRWPVVFTIAGDGITLAVLEESVRTVLDGRG